MDRREARAHASREVVRLDLIELAHTQAMVSSSANGLLVALARLDAQMECLGLDEVERLDAAERDIS